MAENEKQVDVKFLQSLALAIRDKDDEVKHIQLVIVQELESGTFRCFMDVVDPSKVKLQEPSENELPETDPA